MALPSNGMRGAKIDADKVCEAINDIHDPVVIKLICDKLYKHFPQIIWTIGANGRIMAQVADGNR